ncbi:bifunctional DNA primase/polymerase [Rhodococcus sp. BP-241]|uniref:bifunctional DNA primase/polymerase n=1 Tax=Rhodococcus sp. BP-241 TaxID=2739441 RepID=UPI001C9AA4A3|nr:bifunctional DNA primase/polymerase [Rhodococcus sp. BP-241]MBY6708479.1 bifunctional DNA primase/polymerase [Rhodococcus sp. BP-241]
MLDRGFAIGPLNGKRAFLPGGFHSFSADRDVIAAQARRYPHANWGGIRAGVVVLDEDPRNGGDLDALNLSVRTLLVRTGSGGRHAYFEHWGPLRGKVAHHNGIDIKTWQTGYTVMPGGVHPETGELYRVEVDADIAPLPQELLPLVEASTYVPQPTVVSPQRRSNGLVDKVASAHGGGRNALTFWAFCRAYERGGEQSLVDGIRDAALGTGLPEHEVDTCMRSARRTVVRVSA